MCTVGPKGRALADELMVHLAAHLVSHGHPRCLPSSEVRYGACCEWLV